MATSTISPWIWGTGRRKTAVARVRIREGSGNITVNGKKMEEFFSELKHRQNILLPLEVTETRGKFDIFAKVDGGGFSGQAGAMVLGIARALKKFNIGFDGVLREYGLLTRDSRMKERKKYGQAAARKKFQFSKR